MYKRQGEERCIEIDTIGCRVNALVKGYVALPIANIVDTFEPYDAEQDEVARADFYYIDAGAPLDDPIASLLYHGPNWYSQERAMAIRIDGEAKSGPIHGQHFQSTLTCSQHAPADTLVKPYEEITRILTKAMQSIEKFTLVDGGEYRPYTDDEIRKQGNLCLLYTSPSPRD